MWSHELDPMILGGPFQFEIFYDFVLPKSRRLCNNSKTLMCVILLSYVDYEENVL